MYRGPQYLIEMIYSNLKMQKEALACTFLSTLAIYYLTSACDDACPNHPPHRPLFLVGSATRQKTENLPQSTLAALTVGARDSGREMQALDRAASEWVSSLRDVRTSYRRRRQLAARARAAPRPWATKHNPRTRGANIWASTMNCHPARLQPVAPFLVAANRGSNGG